MPRTRRAVKPMPRRRRPLAPPIRDPGRVRPLDSEDQAGTYAPPASPHDTGESDEGIFAQGPLSPRRRRFKQSRGGAAMRPKKKRLGHEQPDPVKDEIPDTLGGTDGDLGVDRDPDSADVVEDRGYDRPAELGDEDERI